jgi:hypothetical protein
LFNVPPPLGTISEPEKVPLLYLIMLSNEEFKISPHNPRQLENLEN